MLNNLGSLAPDSDPRKGDDVDGKSMSEDDDVDGVPLDGAALLKRGTST